MKFVIALHLVCICATWGSSCVASSPSETRMPMSADSSPHQKYNYYRDILWFHFPKSGGTTMRNLLFNYCRQQHYNLSAHYTHDPSTDCSNIPFACLKGSERFFSYGHSIPTWNDFTNSNILHVVMIRDPLSWLLSRYQHYRRKNPTSVLGIVQASLLFGSKYFNFLDNHTHALCDQWFRMIAREEYTTGDSGSDSDRNPDRDINSSSDIQEITTDHRPPPVEVKSHPLYLQILYSYRTHFLQLPHTIVLVTDYYHESLAFLSKIFNTSYFEEASEILFSNTQSHSTSIARALQTPSSFSSSPTSSTSSSSTSSSGAARETESGGADLNDIISRNRADHEQNQQGFDGSIDDMKTLLRILEIHYAIYHATLNTFFEQLESTRSRDEGSNYPFRTVHSRMNQPPSPPPTKAPHMTVITSSDADTSASEVTDNIPQVTHSPMMVPPVSTTITTSKTTKVKSRAVVSDSPEANRRRKKVTGKLKHRGGLNIGI